MSTRSCLYFFGKDGAGDDYSVRVYRHCDGYPSSNLTDLATSVENGGLGDRVVADAFARVFLDVRPTAELNVGTEPHEFKSKLPPEILSNQGDLEWIYLIDCENRSVNVYGKVAGYSGKTALHVAAGPADPMSESKDYMPEYVAMAEEHIRSALSRLEGGGWSCNKAVLPAEFQNACRELGEREALYREAVSRVADRDFFYFQDPSEEAVVVGTVVHVNRGFALQRLDGNESGAHVVHDIRDLDKTPEVGRLASIEYDGSGKGAVDQRFARIGRDHAPAPVRPPVGGGRTRGLA